MALFAELLLDEDDDNDDDNIRVDTPMRVVKEVEEMTTPISFNRKRK